MDFHLAVDFSEQGSGALGGQPIGGTDSIATSSSLGGDVFTGQLPMRSDSAIGTNDKWNSAGPGDRGSGLFGHTSSTSISGGDIWGSEVGGGGMAVGTSRAPGIIGGSNSSLGSIGPGDSGLVPGSSFNSNSGSSALASMLGINLPTGSGSLRETSSLWNGPASSQTPVSSLHGGSGAGVIGSVNRAPGGGIAIGGSGGMPSGGLRSSASMPSGSGDNSDIALLQSLLPGVHITSGNAKQPAARDSSASSGWNPMVGTPIGQPVGNSSGGFGMRGEDMGWRLRWTCQRRSSTGTEPERNMVELTQHRTTIRMETEWNGRTRMEQVERIMGLYVWNGRIRQQWMGRPGMKDVSKSPHMSGWRSEIGVI